MSQPPRRPVAGPQGVTPGPAAAPTRIALPGQVLRAPTPHQQQPQQVATGFPQYVSPPPSPKNRTGLIVGTIVCLVVVVFAVVGFLLVA